MKNASRIAAIGGVTAALAVVIMSMGTLIPVATYVCPMMCALLLQAVLRTCGTRASWAWFGTVAILSILLTPDKEAAAVFLFLGYYPIIKPKLDKRKLPWLWKLLLFNGVTAVMYAALIYLMGMTEIAADFWEAGLIMGIATVLLGNLTFFLLDRLLSMPLKRQR